MDKRDMGKVIELFPGTRERMEREQEERERAPLIEKRKAAIEKLPRYRGEVFSKTQIRQLPNLKAGEIFWVSGDSKAYLIAEMDGKKVTIKALDETATLSTGMTIYDLNKAIISKEKIFDFSDSEALEVLTQRIIKFFAEDSSDTYYLLYGRDIHYVSLLKRDIGSPFDRENCATLFESLANIGNLISIDFNDSDNEVSMEIWVRTADSSADLLYLMPYSRGLIEI